MLANLLFKYITQAIFLFMLTFCAINSASAQDLEPRRWSQMPSGLNFEGVKMTLLSGRSQNLTGADIDSVVFAYSLQF